MKLDVLRMVGQVGAYNFHNDDRKLAIAYALSKNMAYRCSLPSSPVESPAQWFADYHKLTVENIIGEVNENTVINVQEVYELTFKIWKFRYRMVFDIMAVDMALLIDNCLYSEQSELPATYKIFAGRTDPMLLNNFIRDVGYSFVEGQ